ncbi:hypothetical protein EZV62_017174 [Acer yangbiense]|uniref:Pentacotripeptide-repeat region of PRORP domain-containing protein n=1 Tax=Acer yangbiense TaxID=1000413 RepID=A0A5C7HFY6_9ROSI|nr:hypothetical protein EZV62_017174 [Acer yangbiense]
MGALHKIGDVQNELSLYGEMKDLNLDLDSSTFSIAIQCFVENEDIQEACACHNKIIEMSHVPSVAAYCSLAKGLCKIGEIDAAMISGDAEKYGTLEEARKVFTNLRECKLLREASTIVYDEILIEHMKKKTADFVLSGLKFFGLESKLKAKGCTLLPR